jgi:dTDP-4-dehydrorhamnose reductase
MIVGEGDLVDLAVRACEVRGLPYVRCGDEAAERLDEASPWAVLDARDRAGLCARGRCLPASALSAEALAWACADRSVPLAVIGDVDGPNPAGDAPGVLFIRTGRLYAPWERDARAARILDALDSGQKVVVRRDERWDGVYGPDVVDGVLDLLLDGVLGTVTFLPTERRSEAEFARELADVADCDPRLLVARGDPLPEPLFAWSPPASFLPPGKTTLERFVRECRAARRAGVLAVDLRQDDVRLEAAE